VRARHSAREARFAPHMMRRIRSSWPTTAARFMDGRCSPACHHSREPGTDSLGHGRQAGACSRLGPDRRRSARPRTGGRFHHRQPHPAPNLRRAVNRLLPPAIRVLSAEEVHSDFHPRFDAKAKTYEYRMLRDEVCSPFEWPYVHHYPYPLDEERMIQLAAVFEGEHDFTPFAASDDRDAEGKTKVRTVFSSALERRGPRLIYAHPRQRIPEAHGAQHRGHAD
jgi:hypothetical protein